MVRHSNITTAWLDSVGDYPDRIISNDRIYEKAGKRYDGTYAYYKTTDELSISGTLTVDSDVLAELLGTSKTFYASPYDFYDESIEKVIFNPPATIVLWKDGEKTVVKCAENDTFDPEKGLAMAFMKRLCGNKGKYCDILKKWIKDEKSN